MNIIQKIEFSYFVVSFLLGVLFGATVETIRHGCKKCNKPEEKKKLCA